VIAELLSDCSEPITLVTLGPLTNLANALEDDRALVRTRISQHIGMFGCLSQRGSTNRWADFNAWCDPEAADRVVRAGIHTRMVGLDVKRLLIMLPHEVSAFSSSRDPLVKWLGAALRYYVTVHRNRDGLKGCYLHDTLAIGQLFHPGLMTFAARGMRVDLDDGEHRGHTRESLSGYPLHIAVDLDVALMCKLLDRVFGERYAQQGAGENR
jgi:inosine-uridine nucleoside N-ribohydrolase